MKKLFQAILIISILILCNSTTKAFDGNRKGFVLSGGVGIAKYPSKHKDKNALATGFTIGYGLNDKNLLLWDRGLNYILQDNSLFVDQDAGISWFHYYNKQKKSFFTKLGYGFNPEAIYFGGGFMFSNNLQLGFTYLNLTKLKTWNHIQLLISYVAF